MTNERENELIEQLSDDNLTASDVLHLFLDFHGTQLLTDEFAQHCQDEGMVDLDWLNDDDSKYDDDLDD